MTIRNCVHKFKALLCFEQSIHLLVVWVVLKNNLRREVSDDMEKISIHWHSDKQISSRVRKTSIAHLGLRPTGCKGSLKVPGFLPVTSSFHLFGIGKRMPLRNHQI